MPSDGWVFVAKSGGGQVLSSRLYCLGMREHNYFARREIVGLCIERCLCIFYFLEVSQAVSLVVVRIVIQAVGKKHRKGKNRCVSILAFLG